MTTAQDIEAYFGTLPIEVQDKLNAIRKELRSILPDAIEQMKYGLPTFTMKKHIIHFGGFKNHIGIYPTPNAIEVFKDELAKYPQSKGGVKIPLNEELPLDLIKRIALYNLEKWNGGSK
jgi:uncharacterized protein YdhG (YjbR/CyaY superfamily)